MLSHVLNRGVKFVQVNRGVGVPQVVHAHRLQACCVADSLISLYIPLGDKGSPP